MFWLPLGELARVGLQADVHRTEMASWRERAITPSCREFNVVSFTLLLSMVEFKGRVTAGDLDSAMELLASIPKVGAGAGPGEPATGYRLVFGRTDRHEPRVWLRVPEGAWQDAPRQYTVRMSSSCYSSTCGALASQDRTA